MNNQTEQASYHQVQDKATLPQADSTYMPAFFIGHAGPSLAIEKQEYTDFLQSLHKTIPTPKAIVCFSAHWKSPIQTISSVDKYETMYDFGPRHPKECWEVVYPAKGQPNIAKQAQDLFAQNGIRSVFDEERAMDHGVWTILVHMYAGADIPVVTMSVNPEATPEMCYKTGMALQQLREQGVLLLGSGAIVHNLDKLVSKYVGAPDEWATDFDKWIEKTVTDWNTEDMFNYVNRAPGADLAAPDNDHFYPLIYSMGFGDKNKKATLIHRSYQSKNLSRISYRFD